MSRSVYVAQKEREDRDVIRRVGEALLSVELFGNGSLKSSGSCCDDEFDSRVITVRDNLTGLLKRHFSKIDACIAVKPTLHAFSSEQFRFSERYHFHIVLSAEDWKVSFLFPLELAVQKHLVEADKEKFSQLVKHSLFKYQHLTPDALRAHVRTNLESLRKMLAQVPDRSAANFQDQILAHYKNIKVYQQCLKEKGADCTIPGDGELLINHVERLVVNAKRSVYRGQRNNFVFEKLLRSDGVPYFPLVLVDSILKYSGQSIPLSDMQVGFADLCEVLLFRGDRQKGMALWPKKSEIIFLQKYALSQQLVMTTAIAQFLNVPRDLTPELEFNRQMLRLIMHFHLLQDDSRESELLDIPVKLLGASRTMICACKLIYQHLPEIGRSGYRLVGDLNLEGNQACAVAYDTLVEIQKEMHCYGLKGVVGVTITLPRELIIQGVATNGVVDNINYSVVVRDHFNVEFIEDCRVDATNSKIRFPMLRVNRKNQDEGFRAFSVPINTLCQTFNNSVYKLDQAISAIEFISDNTEQFIKTRSAFLLSYHIKFAIENVKHSLVDSMKYSLKGGVKYKISINQFKYLLKILQLTPVRLQSFYAEKFIVDGGMVDLKDMLPHLDESYSAEQILDDLRQFYFADFGVRNGFNIPAYALQKVRELKNGMDPNKCRTFHDLMRLFSPAVEKAHSEGGWSWFDSFCSRSSQSGSIATPARSPADAHDANLRRRLSGNSPWTPVNAARESVFVQDDNVSEGCYSDGDEKTLNRLEMLERLVQSFRDAIAYDKEFLSEVGEIIGGLERVVASPACAFNDACSKKIKVSVEAAYLAVKAEYPQYSLLIEAIKAVFLTFNQRCSIVAGSSWFLQKPLCKHDLINLRQLFQVACGLHNSLRASEDRVPLSDEEYALTKLHEFSYQSVSGGVASHYKAFWQMFFIKYFVEKKEKYYVGPKEYEWLFGFYHRAREVKARGAEIILGTIVRQHLSVSQKDLLVCYDKRLTREIVERAFVSAQETLTGFSLAIDALGNINKVVSPVCDSDTVLETVAHCDALSDLPKDKLSLGGELRKDDVMMRLNKMFCFDPVNYHRYEYKKDDLEVFQRLISSSKDQAQDGVMESSYDVFKMTTLSLCSNDNLFHLLKSLTDFYNQCLWRPEWFGDCVPLLQALREQVAYAMKARYIAHIDKRRHNGAENVALLNDNQEEMFIEKAIACLPEFQSTRVQSQRVRDLVKHDVPDEKENWLRKYLPDSTRKQSNCREEIKKDFEEKYEALKRMVGQSDVSLIAFEKHADAIVKVLIRRKVKTYFGLSKDNVKTNQMIDSYIEMICSLLEVARKDYFHCEDEAREYLKRFDQAERDGRNRLLAMLQDKVPEKFESQTIEVDSGCSGMTNRRSCLSNADAVAGLMKHGLCCGAGVAEGAHAMALPAKSVGDGQVELRF